MPTNKKKKGAKRAPPSTQELVEAADQSEDDAQAVALYTAALTQLDDGEASNNNNNRMDTDDNRRREELSLVLQKRAERLVSLQDCDAALHDFERALELERLSSNPGSSSAAAAHLYLYIGQLQQGQSALEAYRQGVSGLQEQLRRQEEFQGDDDKAAVYETRQQLAAACCSIAELYLTDLCFDDNAEVECESYLQQALTKYTDEAGEPVVDALQTVASLRISQSRPDEAVESMLRAFARISVGCQALATLVGIRASPEQASELLQIDEVQNLPGFEFRCQTAKLLLECAELCTMEKASSSTAVTNQSKCVNAAIDVLGSLLAENDEVIEIWHLLGTAFCLLRPPNTELATQYWERAMEMSTTTKQSLQQDLLEAESDQDIEALEQLLEEVTATEEDIRSRLNELQAEQPQQKIEAS